MRLRIGLALASVVFLATMANGPHDCLAQAHNWIGASGGFDVHSNWDIGVPTANDAANFDLPQAAIITLNGTQNIRFLDKAGSSIFFTGGNVLDTQAASDITEGRLYFLLSGTVFRNHTTLSIGETSTLAEIRVQQGASVEASTTYVGRLSTHSGRIDVSGAGSSWDNGLTLTVGTAGDGELNVQGGGLVTSNNSYIGANSGSDSTVLVDDFGSRWETNLNLIVGSFGNGSLDITDGGFVSSPTSYIGRLPGANGTVTISGDESEFVMDKLYLGTANGFIDGGVGILNIDSLSATHNTRVWVGDYRNASFGRNFLSISDSGTEGKVYVRNGSTISAYAVHVGTGTDNNGELYVNGVGSHVDSGVTLRLGVNVIDTNSYVEIADGGLVTADTGVFSNGTMLLTGDLSQAAFENLYLGSSNGIDDRGTFTVTMFAGDPILSVGDYQLPGLISGSIVLVSDSGSNGELVIRNGSRIDCDYSRIGSGNGNSGEVTVSGANSRWSTSLQSFIGEDGDAVLNILDGATVTAANTIMGKNPGSQGIVSVSGANSELTIAHTLTIGDSGDGSLSIDQGGIVVAANEVLINSQSNVNLDNGELRTGNISNSGSIGFSGPSTIQGDLVVEPGGSIRVTGTATALFTDLVEHNGFGIETQSNATTTFAGGLKGNGALFGNGDIHIDELLEPGNGAAGFIDIENSVILTSTATTKIEVGGTNNNQFDRLAIDGSFNIDGDLEVNFINGHKLSRNDVYQIVTLGGISTGAFDGLPEGAIITRSNGYLLRISYVGGNGNDVVLYADFTLQHIGPSKGF